MRSFNTAGPVKSDKHYCIPPLERIDLDDVLRLVRWNTGIHRVALGRPEENHRKIHRKMGKP